MYCNRLSRLIIFTLIAGWAGMTAAEWSPHTVRQLNGNEAEIRIPAKMQIVTEPWNRVAAVPYIVYMPEKDRVLMVVTCDARRELDPLPLVPYLISSDDRGESWMPPRLLHTDPQGQPDAVGVGCGLTYLGGGMVWCYAAPREKQSPNEGDSGWLSRDFGETWEGPLRGQPAPNGKPWSTWDPLLVDHDPASGKVVRLADTRYQVVEYTSNVYRSLAYFLTSDDLGRTWSSVQVPQWESVDEVALCRAANGDLVAACRTNMPKRFAGNIDHYEGLAISLSKDNGRTWSDLNRLYAWGRHHPSMVVLPDGRIVMTYVVRKGYTDTGDGKPQFGVEAVVSRDHGQTWDLDHRYILHAWEGNQPSSVPNAWWSSSQATSSVLLPDGSILTAFGTGYRSEFQRYNTPRDVGLVLWRLGDQPLNDDRTIRDAPFDSDLRNVVDLSEICPSPPR